MGRAGKGGVSGNSGGGSTGSGGRGFSGGGNRSFAGRSGNSRSSGSSSQNQGGTPYNNNRENYNMNHNTSTQNNKGSSFPVGILLGSLLGSSRRNNNPPAQQYAPPQQQYAPQYQNTQQQQYPSQYQSEPQPTPGRTQNQGASAGKSNKLGCIIIAIVAVIGIAILFFFLQSSPTGGSGTSNNISPSTIKRVPLPAGSVNETAYYSDELAWIGDASPLLSGMKDFYSKTGVQPYLHITDNIKGSRAPSDAQAEAFATELYDELFTDEAHILVIFFEYQGTYRTWALAGTQAQAVLDTEAVDILLDNIDLYYFSDLSEGEMFGRAFSETAQRIMTVTTSPWIPVLIVIAVLVILVVAFLWWRGRKQQKNLEAEHTKAILETPLETFEGSEAANIAEKYSTTKEKAGTAASSAEDLAEKYKDK